MASTTLEFVAPSQLSLTVELYAHGSDVIANGVGGDSTTERTNAKGIYEATVTEALAGWYQAVIKNGSGTVIALYDVFLVDDTGRYRCEDRPQKLHSRIESMAELTAVPAATPDMWDMLMLLYMRARNYHKTDASSYNVYNDAGALIGSKVLDESETEYTEEKMS